MSKTWKELIRAPQVFVDLILISGNIIEKGKDGSKFHRMRSIV